MLEVASPIAIKQSLMSLEQSNFVNIPDRETKVNEGKKRYWKTAKEILERRKNGDKNCTLATFYLRKPVPIRSAPMSPVNKARKPIRKINSEPKTTAKKKE